jgi:hypothetical protein
MHAAVEPQLLAPPAPSVVAFVRRAPGQVLVALHNLGEAEQELRRASLPLLGPQVDALTGRPAGDEVLRLAGYGARWLVPAVG